MEFKDFREFNLKMSQGKFADYLGLSLEQIRQFEKNSDEIPLKVLTTLANKTGKSIDEIAGYERPKVEPIKPDNTWSSADFTKKTLIEYIKRFSDKWHEVWGDRYSKYIKDLDTCVKNTIKKPKVAVVGRSDVGKSTLINCILGSEKMPVEWNPTTSIVVYIKHIDDRPGYIKDDVWILKRGEQDAWDESRLDDEKYCTEWKLAGGSIEILESYGTHKGDSYKENKVGSAIAFVDSDVLKNCDLMDLPGFGTGNKTETTSATLDVSGKANILIYMSLANGFMRDDDFVFLQAALENLQPIESVDNIEVRQLSNLFIIASHAKSVNEGNPEALNSILDRGCSDFWKSLSDNFWNEREKLTGFKYTKEMLRKRFFTFTPEIADLRRDLEKGLKFSIEIVPKLINERAKLFVKDFAKEKGVNLDAEIKSYNEMVSDKEKYETLLKKIEKAEPARANATQNARMEASKKIGDLQRESISDFADRYTRIISVDNIVKTIKINNFKNKKRDRNILTTYLGSTLKTELESVIGKKSEELKKVIDEYISGFETSVMSDEIGSLGINFTFNAKIAFASGLAGLTTLGGLAFLASTWGNFGASILIAKGASILAVSGISTGSTIASTPVVAAIGGGPIMIAIALSILAAVTVFAIFWGGWKNSLAKQIVKTYDKENVIEKYNQVISQFWKDTQNAFDSSAYKLEKEWKEYVANLRKMINNYDIDDLMRSVQAAEEMKVFFSNIPL